MSDNESSHASTPVVALAAWLLPGAGYWLLGQKARALTTGITIIALFVIGLLIGGIRVIEVPGYGDHGLQKVVLPGNSIQEESSGGSDNPWVMFSDPMSEIRDKPWYVAQVLAGPINLIASWGSVVASHVKPDGNPVGYRSHARTNELGVLYTAIAGMLNLLTIIDAGSRAGKTEEAA